MKTAARKTTLNAAIDSNFDTIDKSADDQDTAQEFFRSHEEAVEGASVDSCHDGSQKQN